ncbi:hypothetical protein [Marinicella litoralis]|uniref:Parallel beta helix pectate lyase-like protein n=1 Tax=Marinicella litoralis TaxID=644220 RepID=A0A4V3DH98_9GAMM|nr:hypothetical protein [Marinicella litoralis]TDR17411.1 hypothetical protein C8D91_2469 [Marinicella litoralis]
MIIKYTSKMILLGFLGLLFLKPVHAASFCVSNGAELQNALAIADSNNQTDHIKLRFGVFTAPTGGFTYSGFTEDHDLEISGNWFTFNNNSCGSRILANDPLSHSTLSGNNTASALNIIPGALGDISISYLVLTEGNAGDFGGGLRLFPLAEYLGNVLIENNVFIDNTADEAGALYVVGGNRLVIRNNLFTENQSDSSTGSVIISQQNSVGTGDSPGVYFTNNTVMNNFASVGHTNLFAGTSIKVYESSSAFMANNIFWANTAGDLSLTGDGYKYLFNNDLGVVIGAADETSGNFSVTPEFETGLLNFKPALNSALSNRGKRPPTFTHIPPHFDELWSLGDLDLSGAGRIYGTTVDVGAIESESLSDLIFEDGFE